MTVSCQLPLVAQYTFAKAMLSKPLLFSMHQLQIEIFCWICGPSSIFLFCSCRLYIVNSTILFSIWALSFPLRFCSSVPGGSCAWVCSSILARRYLDSLVLLPFAPKRVLRSLHSRRNACDSRMAMCCLTCATWKNVRQNLKPLATAYCKSRNFAEWSVAELIAPTKTTLSQIPMYPCELWCGQS